MSKIGILSDLMHTGVNMGLGYGMNQLGSAVQGLTNPPTGTDQSPRAGESALGSSGINASDPLTKLALRNMQQSGIPGMMPSGGGLGSSAIGGILSAIPGILSLL